MSTACSTRHAMGLMGGLLLWMTSACSGQAQTTAGLDQTQAQPLQDTQARPVACSTCEAVSDAARLSWRPVGLRVALEQRALATRVASLVARGHAPRDERLVAQLRQALPDAASTQERDALLIALAAQAEGLPLTLAPGQCQPLTLDGCAAPMTLCAQDQPSPCPPDAPCSTLLRGHLLAQAPRDALPLTLGYQLTCERCAQPALMRDRFFSTGRCAQALKRRVDQCVLERSNCPWREHDPARCPQRAACAAQVCDRAWRVALTDSDALARDAELDDAITQVAHDEGRRCLASCAALQGQATCHLLLNPQPTTAQDRCQVLAAFVVCREPQGRWRVLTPG